MVINKPEIYIKGLKYSLIPIGYLMNIIGKLTTNQRVELLGHYLSCSGNKYTLNSKILNEALDKGNIQITPLPMIKYGFIIKPGHLEDNYILGKFFLIVDENGYATIIDQYKFYPWNNFDKSFNSSNNNLDWAQIQLIKHFTFSKSLTMLRNYNLYIKEKGYDDELKWNKIHPIIICNTFSYGRLFNITIVTSIHSISIEISIRDKIFYFLGKSFNVRTNKFKLPEKVFLSLKNEWKREYRSYKELQEFNLEERKYANSL